MINAVVSCYTSMHTCSYPDDDDDDDGVSPPAPVLFGLAEECVHGWIVFF